MRKKEAYSVCSRYLNQYVNVQTKDGRVYNGVIEKVDHNQVYLAIPKGSYREGDRSYPSNDRHRESSYGYYPYHPYPYLYPYAYPYPYPYAPYYYPRRRYRRIALPLSFLTGIALGGLLL